MKKITAVFVWKLACNGWWVWLVWHHAHWTVAVTIAMLLLRNELEDYAKELEKLRHREDEDLFAKLRSSMAGGARR